MKPTKDDVQLVTPDMLFAAAADQFAQQMDDVLLDIEELDPSNCPPDKRYNLGDREAWVYEHGNICELFFVGV